MSEVAAHNRNIDLQDEEDVDSTEHNQADDPFGQVAAQAIDASCGIFVMKPDQQKLYINVKISSPNCLHDFEALLGNDVARCIN
jgi:hypothetical protein